MEVMCAGFWETLAWHAGAFVLLLIVLWQVANYLDRRINPAYDDPDKTP